MRLEAKKYLLVCDILVQGYADVADRLVWDIVETKLPLLRREVAALLKDA